MNVSDIIYMVYTVQHIHCTITSLQITTCVWWKMDFNLTPEVLLEGGRGRELPLQPRDVTLGVDESGPGSGSARRVKKVRLLCARKVVRVHRCLQQSVVFEILPVHTDCWGVEVCVCVCLRRLQTDKSHIKSQVGELGWCHITHTHTSAGNHSASALKDQFVTTTKTCISWEQWRKFGFIFVSEKTWKKSM